MNITIDFKHHSNNPQKKHLSPTIFFSKKNQRNTGASKGVTPLQLAAEGHQEVLRLLLSDLAGDGEALRRALAGRQGDGRGAWLVPWTPIFGPGNVVDLELTMEKRGLNCEKCGWYHEKLGFHHEKWG